MSALSLSARSLDQMCVEGVYLKSIVFTLPHDWVITIDETKYTPEKLPKHIKIIKVTDSAVLFERHKETFLLPAGKSYDYLRKKIVRGRCALRN